jgi:hypothetical protein
VVADAETDDPSRRRAWAVRRAAAVVPRREPGWARDLGAVGHPWLLSDGERGNGASGLPDWREGNDVHALVDGRAYLPALAAALGGAGERDAVLFAGFRTDANQLLDDGGP